jgi:hypothetical protein
MQLLKKVVTGMCTKRFNLKASSYAPRDSAMDESIDNGISLRLWTRNCEPLGLFEESSTPSNRKY